MAAPEAPEAAAHEEMGGEEAEDLGGAGEIEEEAAPAPGGAGGASPGLEELRARYRGLTPQQLQQILAHQQAQRAKQEQQKAAQNEPEGLEAATEEWKGLKQMPVATQNVLKEHLQRLQAGGKREISVLLLGKGGVGKSTLVNQMLGERKLRVNPYGLSSQDRVVMLSRKVAEPAQGSGQGLDVTLNVIDTPGLLLNDRVHESALSSIAAKIQGKPIDVVLYVDRLDLYAVETMDRHVIAAVGRVLGKGVWEKTLVVLTHGDSKAPAGMDYEAFANRRSDQLRAAMRKAGGGGACPVAIVENSSLCNRNWGGEKVLPDAAKTPWIPALMQQIVDVALAKGSFVLKANANSPDKKWRWLVPLLVGAQALLVKYVFVPAMAEDGRRGDSFGPWDKKFDWVRASEYAYSKNKGKKGALSGPPKPAAKPKPKKKTSGGSSSSAAKKKAPKEAAAPAEEAAPAPATPTASVEKSGAGGSGATKKKKKKKKKKVARD